MNQGRTDSGATSLFIAAQHNNTDVIEVLVKNGAGVNQARFALSFI